MERWETDLATYTAISAAEWQAIVDNPAYKHAGSSEAGFALAGPNGDIVFWCNDYGKPCRMVEK
jgi:hypothetical protein